MRTHIDRSTSPTDEPVAIVGVACRVPGARDAASFWRLLVEGVDAVSEVPPERYDVREFYDGNMDAPGKMCTRWGGFLTSSDRVDAFDAAFFGISPREAVHVDPQQRLMLELAFHGLEDAGIALAGIRGGTTGVFVGTMWNEFASLAYRDPPSIAQHTTTGCDNSVIAGRVSYWLDLHGPSLTVTTGCSSSLVAVHLACESLRRGESDLAIAGGVNLLLSPETTIGLSKLGVLSPTGRCKAFDAAADGYVRSEGGGIVVLKPLSSAIRDRDRIYATILGSAINNDGATTGLTAPNVNAQAAVVRNACARGGVSPMDLDYVEAHGTGTALGDRIEAHALGAACRAGFPDIDPLAVGSVKTNVGHLEGAAGIIGLIKTALCLQHRRIPGNLHFADPSPLIDFAALGVQVVDHERDWPRTDARNALAGVSSFGFGGTNCHVVLEGLPSSTPSTPSNSSNSSNPSNSSTPSNPVLLVISARSPEALDAQAAQLREFLGDAPGLDLGNLAFSLATTREAFEYRLATVARDGTELLERLSDVAHGHTSGRVSRGLVPAERHKVAFLYTGQGAQYLGMGRGLYRTFPVFREALDRSAAIIAPVLGEPLLDVMFATEGTASALLLNRTEYAQPALFALEWSLSELWRSFGIVPDVVMGHSLGEYVAACVAGVFSLEEGLRLVAERGRLMQRSAEGAMVSCQASPDVVADRIGPWHESVSIAALNGSEQVVISGRRDAVEAVAASFAADGIAITPLQTSHGFHSPLMDPQLDDFEEFIAGIGLHEPRLPLVSNLTGFVATSDVATPGYWRHHARQPVQFERGLRTMNSIGVRTFVELGPRPVLVGIGARAIDDRAQWLPSLRQPDDTGELLLSGLGSLFAEGATVDWTGVFAGDSRRRIDLPFYPFQRTRYERWYSEPRSRLLDRHGLVDELTMKTGLAAETVQKTVDALKAIGAGEERTTDGARAIAAAPSGPTLAVRLRLASPDRHLSEIESEVRIQVARVLELPATSRLLDGPFTTLGLDSLMAIQARNALADELGQQLPATLLFSYDTVDKLSRHLLECWHTGASESSRADIVVPSAHDPYNVSSGQRRFWFLDQLLPRTCLYNVLSVFRIRGPVDRDLLRQSLGDVLRRHDVLRTTFDEDNGRPRRKVTTSVDLDRVWQDADSLADGQVGLDRFAHTFGSQPFDLERDIPIRVALVTLDASTDPERALVVTWHHIAVDAWSQAIFRRDLRIAYRARSAMPTTVVPAPALQYADAAAAETRWLASAESSADRTYWIDTLRNLPLLDLPAARPAPIERTFGGGHVPFAWTPELTDQIKKLAAKMECTVFHVLLACYVTLLHRASRHTDIGVGTLYANRDSRDVADLVGPFVNTVVMRCDVSGAPDFATLVSRIRTTARSAFEHGHLPFDEVVRVCGSSRQGELNPLFRHAFAWQSVPVMEDVETRTTGWSWTDASPNPAGSLKGTAKFDLNLVMAERDGRLGGIFEYSSDLFDLADVERMAARFEVLTREAVADPNRPVSESAAVTSTAVPAERTVTAIWTEVLGHDEFGPDDDFFLVGGHSLLLPQIASALGRAFGKRCRLRTLFQCTTVAAIAREMSGATPGFVINDVAPLHVAFAARAERQPQATALRELNGPSITYEALARRAAEVEARLRNVGVGAGSFVGVNLDRSVDYVAAVLGVMRTGAAFIPVPAGDPVAHNAAIMAFAGVRAVIRSDGVHELNTSGPSNSRLSAPTADDACVVLASSGSTGPPKLVVRSHRSFFHRIHWTHRTLPYVDGDLCCLKSHPTTTHCLYELFEPLLGGAPSVIFPDDIARDVEAFWERVDELGVTRLLVVPSFVRASLEMPGFAAPGRVRILTLMGEPVDPHLAARVLAAVSPETAVHSIYGTTEASSVLLSDLRADLRDGRLPIGRPIDAATEVQVLDESGARVPPGTEGLLHVAGTALFTEYLHQPEATARAFVRDQAGGPPRFNTGDRVRVGADGALEYVGRADRAVKIRGFRVDPGDVEHFLLQQPGITAAAVIAGSDRVGRPTLTAFVAPADVDRAALLDRMRAGLPPHMIPGRVRVLDQLPRTASGKVDGQSLSAMAHE